ncbi:hypothetical protein OsJ_15840 [Oryza sativa Japonica Group]|uniref:Uncharacterized protein n=1 Tax=Oryza sativa subsp. japonica TaxID=39947 RepID=B9FC27_ORYSJ|nr:hypothetical protein OsJ_15840 [Oryza sativa Japonica Group]
MMRRTGSRREGRPGSAEDGVRDGERDSTGQHCVSRVVAPGGELYAEASAPGRRWRHAGMEGLGGGVAFLVVAGQPATRRRRHFISRSTGPNG